MLRTHFLRPTLSQRALIIVCAFSIFNAPNHSASAQAAAEEEQIVVTGEEVPSAYGAPPGLSRSRFSNAVNAYVLPPWSFFFGELYEGQGFAMGRRIIFSLKKSKWVCRIVST